MSLKNPNWNDAKDKEMYINIFYRQINKFFTEDEEMFCKTMYHAEEFDCGLDGDRK